MMPCFGHCHCFKKNSGMVDGALGFVDVTCSGLVHVDATRAPTFCFFWGSCRKSARVIVCKNGITISGIAANH